MLALFDRALNGRFLKPEHRALVLVDTEVDALLEQLAAYQPIKGHKLIESGNS